VPAVPVAAVAGAVPVPEPAADAAAGIANPARIPPIRRARESAASLVAAQRRGTSRP